MVVARSKRVTSPNRYTKPKTIKTRDDVTALSWLILGFDDMLQHHVVGTRF